VGSSGADGAVGAFSPPSSSAKRPGGDEALGVWSQSDVEQPVVEDWEAVAVVGLSLLKTGPSTESSSDSISTTLLSQGGGASDTWAAARMTMTIGVQGVGEGATVAGTRV